MAQQTPFHFRCKGLRYRFSVINSFMFAFTITYRDEKYLFETQKRGKGNDKKEKNCTRREV